MSQQDLQSWFLSLLSFEVRTGNALTDEERRSVEEDKARFFEEIGVDGDLLRSWFISFIGFHIRSILASTDEERRLVEAEKVRFLKAVEDYKKALDEYIREKRQNSIPPAA